MAIYGRTSHTYGAGPDSLCLSFTSFFHTHIIHVSLIYSYLSISLHQTVVKRLDHLQVLVASRKRKTKTSGWMYGNEVRWKTKKRWSKVIIVSCRSCIEGGINCWAGNTVYNRQVVHQWVEACSLLWLNVWNQSGLCVKNVIVDSTKIE